MCLVGEDRVFTGDTLLIGGTGRTDLPTGDPEALYDSLFGKLLTLDPALLVYPGARLQGAQPLDDRRRDREQPAPAAARARRLRRDDESLDLSMPTHLTEALRTNMSGGKTVAQLLAEATAHVPFMTHGRAAQRASRAAPTSSSCSTCARRTPTRPATSPARASCRAASSSCASTRSCPIPTARIVTYCEFGQISTLAAATLRDDGLPARGRARRRHEGVARGRLSDARRRAALSAPARRRGRARVSRAPAAAGRARRR